MVLTFLGYRVNGGAEIAMQQAAKIIDVLHDERTVITGRVDTLLQFLGE